MAKLIPIRQRKQGFRDLLVAQGCYRYQFKGIDCRVVFELPKYKLN